MKPDKDKLIELYWKQGLSMPKAAREIGIGKSTLEYWMKKFGIPRRPLLRYPRAIFEGGFQEKAYLLGLRYGDLYVVPYKKGICIETTTSHPAMAELFWQTFRRYGHIYMHPLFNKTTRRYQWILRVVVHESFSFLLDKPLKPPEWALREESFLHFLAGFFDFEGCIHIVTRVRQGRWRVIELALSLSNTRKRLLGIIASRIRSYHPIVELNSAEGIDRWASGGIRKKNLWRLIVERRLMVKQLLLQLPIRHPEKTSKSAIAVAALEGLPHNEVRKRVLAWRLSIRQEKQAFARLASSQCRFQTRFHEPTSR